MLQLTQVQSPKIPNLARNHFFKREALIKLLIQGLDLILNSIKVSQILINHQRFKIIEIMILLCVNLYHKSYSSPIKSKAKLVLLSVNQVNRIKYNQGKLKVCNNRKLANFSSNNLKIPQSSKNLNK